MHLHLTPARPWLRDAAHVDGLAFAQPAHHGTSVCVDGRKFHVCACGWTEEWWNREPVCGMELAHARFLEELEQAAAKVLAEQTRGHHAATELLRARAGERR